MQFASVRQEWFMLIMLPPPALEASSWTLPCCAFFHIGSKVLCLLTVANPNIAFQCARLSFRMGLAGEASHFCTFRSKVSPACIDRWPSKAFVQHVSKTSMDGEKWMTVGACKMSISHTLFQYSVVCNFLFP